VTPSRTAEANRTKRPMRPMTSQGRTQSPEWYTGPDERCHSHSGSDWGRRPAGARAIVAARLRRIAAAGGRESRARGSGPDLQATALVHEAYLRLVGRPGPASRTRGHFFTAAAEAMAES